MNLNILMDGSFSGIFLYFKSLSNCLDESSSSANLQIKFLLELLTRSSLAAVTCSSMSSISLSKKSTLFFKSFPRVIPLNISFSVTFFQKYIYLHILNIQLQ